MSPGSQVQMMTSADGLLGTPGPIQDSRGERGSIDDGIGVRGAEIGELIEDVGPIDSRALVDRSVGLQPIIGAVRPLAEAPSAFTPDRRMPGKTIIRVTEGE